MERSTQAVPECRRKSDMDSETPSDDDLELRVLAVNASYSYGSESQSSDAPASSEAFPTESERAVTSDIFDDIPDGVMIRILQFLPLKTLKNVRIVNRRWYNLSLSHRILHAYVCFVVDGRVLDQTGTRFQNYLEKGSQHGMQPFCTLRIQKCSYDQLAWMTSNLTSTLTHVELNNCSIRWSNILHLLSQLESLTSFADVQDMYCWDYITFSEGIDSDVITENTAYQTLNLEQLEHLHQLKRIEIHRSQITDCTLYMKIFCVWCDHLEYLSVTTDQSLSPRPTAAFYNCLGQLIQKNVDTLRSLWFPYKSIYPIYELRVADDHFPFRDFLVFVTENRWGEGIKPQCLTELAIQFPVIHIEEFFFKERLLPFLDGWISVRKLLLNCIYVEPGLEHLILESLPKHISDPVLGLWWSDINTGQVPTITQVKTFTQTISIQPFRVSLGRQLRDFIPLYDPDDMTQTNVDAENCHYPMTKELQFFSKSPHFRFFNVELITRTFGKLTHLNLVDHNTRIDRNHASDSPCTLEDEDLQLIIINLKHLTFLQLIGNLVYLTDAGITGLLPTASRRMLKLNSFEETEGDQIGVPLHRLQCLKTLVLRGVGIKVTDVSAHFGFCYMPYLRKLHIYGAQQITPAGRMYLQSQCWCCRGCDVQV